MARRFSVILTPDPEDGGYVVTVPALPGCVSEGDTVEEALANIRDAIALFVASAADHNEPLPADVQPLVTTVEVAV
ncbi:MAG: type II toxin-antitoxin system HicB family antitoxin [Thermoanaerobacterales bacterium]|nr:type II toxin-antitoxin system HicB family antitoxin [Thermoanaerobacterales bacterium]